MHRRRVTVARARPKASRRRPKASTSARRAPNNRIRWSVHQQTYWRRSRAYASRVSPLVGGQEPRQGELLVRVDDALHDKRREDRFERIVPLAPQQRAEIRIALASIRQTPSGRQIDLTRISAIMLFNSNGRANERLYLGSIRLE